MKKITNAFFALALLVLFQPLMADHLSGSLQMTARMTGAQEVPPVSGVAQGLGIFTLSLDKQSVLVEFAAADLTGPIMGIHIHEGAPGTNGPVVVDLTPFVNGCTVNTTISVASLDRAKLLGGDYYLNVHTAANPGGEVRAQILLETDFRYTAYLNGGNEVPSVSTTALGWGSFNLSKAGYELEVNVSTMGLSGPITGAHLHLGAAGTNGPVIQNLTPFISGQSIVGAVVDPSAYSADIAAGNVYINVHTAANPGGEIRAQLTLQQALTFDAYATGAQEVPPVTTSAFALGTVNVDLALSTLTFHLIADGLSGPITGAHIHEGEFGSTGGVVYDLTPLLNGNEIIGTLPLNDIASLNTFLSGGYYWNIHTAANPGGEIRGQVYKLARENYSYTFGPENEVPASACAGSGVGMVTIDRGQSNAHYMMVVCEMDEPIAAAHFHNAAAGSTGGVIFDLGPSFANFNNTAAYGYWTEQTTFTSAESVMFRNNMVYANIHTANCPGGAIRGDSVRGRDVAFSDASTVPTMSQWGLILLTLLILNFVSISVLAGKTSFAGMNKSGTTYFNWKKASAYPFEKLAFKKAMNITLGLILGIAIFAILVYGFFTPTDVLGLAVTAPIFAYLMHLLILSNKENA